LLGIAVERKRKKLIASGCFSDHVLETSQVAQCPAICKLLSPAGREKMAMITFPDGVSTSLLDRID
jgi:hypothetical protein